MGADGLLIGIGLLAGVALGPLALLFVLPLLLWFQLVRHDMRYGGIVVVTVAILIGAARAGSVSDVMTVDALTESTAAIGVVKELPVPGGSFERVFVQIDQLRSGENNWEDAPGGIVVYLPEGGPSVGVGDSVLLHWTATPGDRLAPGYGRFVEGQGASGSARVWSYSVERTGSRWLRTFTNTRRNITLDLQNAIPGDAGALAAGVVTGDDSGLSMEAEQAFSRTGTRHITAVSGQNVGLLIGFLAVWMRPGRRATRLFTHAAMIILVWLYVLMVGLEAPAMRAAIFATAMILGSWFGKRPDPLTILSLTLGGMAVLDPRMVDSVGFWLSSAASWALCSSVITRESSGIMTGMIDSVKGVMAANIATLPILLWTFGEWSPMSLLANLLIGPIMTMTFPAAYLLAVVAFIFPIAVPWMAWIPAIGLDIVLVIVDRLASVLPLLYLPVTSPLMALLVSLPCFGALALMSRDGDRWRSIVAWEWRNMARRAAP